MFFVLVLATIGALLGGLAWGNAGGIAGAIIGGVVGIVALSRFPFLNILSISQCAKCGRPFSRARKVRSRLVLHRSDDIVNGKMRFRDALSEPVGPGAQCRKCRRTYCTRCVRAVDACECGSRSFRTVGLRYDRW